MAATMSYEDREAKVKLLSNRENRLSLTNNPTNTTTNNNNHSHGSGPGLGPGLGPSKVVTFSTEEDGNELSEEDMRYLEGGREGAIDAAVALKAFAEHKSANGGSDHHPHDIVGGSGTGGSGGTGGTGGMNSFQLAKDKAKQLEQVVAFAIYPYTYRC